MINNLSRQYNRNQEDLDRLTLLERRIQALEEAYDDLMNSGDYDEQDS